MRSYHVYVHADSQCDAISSACCQSSEIFRCLEHSLGVVLIVLLMLSLLIVMTGRAPGDSLHPDDDMGDRALQGSALQ